MLWSVVCLFAFFPACKTENKDNEPAPTATHVYIAGVTTSPAGFQTPCTWKDGSRSELSTLDTGKLAYAYSVFVIKN